MTNDIVKAKVEKGRKSPHDPDSRVRGFSVRRKLVLSTLIGVLTYVVAETIATSLYSFGTIELPASVWVVEKPREGRIFRFDPIRGYWLSPTPARVAHFRDGHFVEFDSFRGNNYGFPDRDDFVAKRPSSTTTRIAIFGDSYTAAQFLKLNWPDRVEDLAREQKIPLRLLNFSVDGGGLANWWSVLTRIVDSEDFELDGVIFAVFENDLQRTFHWRDDGFDATDGGDINVLMGYSPTWDPATYPTKLEQSPANRVARVIIQPSEKFGQIVRQKQMPSIKPPFRLFIAHKFRVALSRLVFSPSSSEVHFNESLDPGPRPASRAHLIEDIARYLKTNSLPAMVVYVPYASGNPFDVQDVTRFAVALDAALLDGATAYQGLDLREIASLWTGPDEHWNQEGSNLFAHFMLEILNDWPRPDR